MCYPCVLPASIASIFESGPVVLNTSIDVNHEREKSPFDEMEDLCITKNLKMNAPSWFIVQCSTLDFSLAKKVKKNDCRPA